MPEIQAAYIDDAGHPQLRESIVGFLDILGFSQLAISETRPQESQQLLERIVAAIQDSRRHVREILAEELSADPHGWAVKYFSDNLVLGYPVEATDAATAMSAWLVIRAAQRYQLRMALNGFFLRGALTLGPVCLTDDIIFGSALIECYQLESKASIVPRVLLAEPLQKMVTKAFNGTGLFGNLARESICRDVDGWWFVNYLQAACGENGVDWGQIERHKQSIMESLSHTTRHDVLPKFGWACRYHNVFCHWHRNDAGFSSRFRVDRTDEQSTICRLSEVAPVSQQS